MIELLLMYYTYRNKRNLKPSNKGELESFAIRESQITSPPQDFKPYLPKTCPRRPQILHIERFESFRTNMPNDKISFTVMINKPIKRKIKQD